MSAVAALTTELVTLVRSLRELGASLPHVGGRRLDLPTLGVLGRVGDEGPLRLSALAERLCLDVSTVSRQVPALEQRGWLAREADPADGRAQLLRLTPQGHAALHDHRTASADLLRSVLAGWTDEELAALAGSVARLNADLSASRPASAAPAQSAPVVQEAS